MTEINDIRRTWVEIDLRAFDRNLDRVCAMLPEGAGLIPVLKADAYGHGAVELARRCTNPRVAMLAVALLEEAEELRRAGVAHPLLVLGPLTGRQVAAAAEMGIEIGVPGPEEMMLAAEVARGREVLVHLKLDTGMGRMGTMEAELAAVAEMLRRSPGLQLRGIYSHLANAGDESDPFAAEQIARFGSLVGTLREAGITAPRLHIANGPGIVRGLVRPGELARTGILPLGAEPLDRPGHRLQPVLRWRSEIARLKELPAAHAVGYGTTWRASRPSRIATIPVGYADGYPRALSNCGEVLVRGRRAPVVGRVSMDLVTIDVTDVPGTDVSDEVVLIGGQGSEEVTVDEIAAKVGTISYEVFCGISSRVPRVYVDGAAVRVVSRFGA